VSRGTTGAPTVPRLAWSLWALSVALTLFALLLLVLNLNHPGVHVYDYWLENTLSALLFSTVGALVGSRRPQNPVGWLLCLYGLANAVGHFSSQYAIYALLTRSADAPPAGEARNETNLDSLSGELVGVVRETMQPQHASLWLRRPEDSP
jgi:hypothetical protein